MNRYAMIEKLIFRTIKIASSLNFIFKILKYQRRIYNFFGGRLAYELLVPIK